MPYELKGRNVLITGGSAGLGELLSITFAKEGANVAINYFNRIEPAQKVQKQCQELGVKAVLIRADITSTSEAKRVVKETIEQLGGLDIILANAGWTRFSEWADLDSMSEEDWDKCWSANVKVPKTLLSEARAKFDANPDGGLMITTGSIAAIGQGGSSMPYAVTKAAQFQLVKCLAVTVGPKIRVNTVLPGLLLTEWGRNYSPEQIKGLKDRAPLKQETFLDDCVAAFVMLAKNTSMTGQGVQRVGMTTPWLEAFPNTAKPILEEIDDTLKLPLTKTIESGTNAELTKTENAQPAIMATSILILRILENDFGFKTDARVDITLGHSLGEFAALVAGGYLTFRDALQMVRKRAEVMSKCSQEAVERDGGEFGMVALVCESEERMQALINGIHEFLAHGSKADSHDHLPAVQQVTIANLNSKNQIVLSGKITRINTLLTNLRQFGGHDPRHVRLKSDAPFHSLLMKPAQETMKRILYKQTEDGRDIVTWPGIMPCISNVSGKPFQDKEQLKDLLARSCAETVQWWKSIKYLHEEEKIMRYVGIGPGKVGRNLVGKEVGMKGAVKGGGVWGITSPKEMEEKSIDDLTSRFSVLEIEELAVEGPDSIEQTKPAATPAPPPKVVYTLETIDEGRWFAMYCLLRDYNSIKAVNIMVWESFCRDHANKSQKADFMSAAATSQAAMQMIKSLVHKFSSFFPEIKDSKSFYIELLRQPAFKEAMRNVKYDDHGPPLVMARVGLFKHSGLATFFETSNMLERYHHQAVFSLRPTTIQPLIESEHIPNDLPSFHALINALEDIAILIDLGIELPAMDNFTQTWYTYLKQQRDDRAKEQKKQKPANLSIEMLLYTDLYIQTQMVFNDKISEKLQDHYFALHEYLIDTGDHLEIPRILRQTSDAKRKPNLKSYLKDEQKTTQIARFIMEDIFCSEREARANAKDPTDTHPDTSLNRKVGD
ncbi:S-malonyltransferase [Pyrenophora tritici-repentis]|nr:S-malonyltransferase [Pyrenophora tritici-repentis]